MTTGNETGVDAYCEVIVRTVATSGLGLCFIVWTAKTGLIDCISSSSES